MDMTDALRSALEVRDPRVATLRPAYGANDRAEYPGRQHRTLLAAMMFLSLQKERLRRTGPCQRFARCAIGAVVLAFAVGEPLSRPGLRPAEKISWWLDQTRR